MPTMTAKTIARREKKFVSCAVAAIGLICRTQRGWRHADPVRVLLEIPRTFPIYTGRALIQNLIQNEIAHRTNRRKPAKSNRCFAH